MEKITIDYQDKIITLLFNDFEEEVDIDQYTTIDYNNLFAEAITISALMNRVGILKAEAENAHAELKLDVDIYMAKMSESYRKSLTKVTKDEKGATKIKYPTVDEVANAVTLDEGVQLKQRKLLRLKKEVAYMDSLYWSVKSKDTKLNNLTEFQNLTPPEHEVELTEKKINGILIRIREKLIK